MIPTRGTDQARAKSPLPGDSLSPKRLWGGFNPAAVRVPGCGLTPSPPVAEEIGATEQQVMLAWLWSKPNMLPLIASSSIAQLDETLAALRIVLSAGQISRLDTAYA